MAMEQENNGNMPQEHPLLNTVVLKQVFEYLKPSVSLDTLKSIRQVCTVWRDESLGWWRETAVFQLTWEMFEKYTDPGITVAQLEEKPFHKYKLKDALFIIPDCYEIGSQTNGFWNTFGLHMKHLILTNVQFTTEGFLQPVYKPLHVFMQFLIDYLPNLATLYVEGTHLREFVVPEDYDKNMLEMQHPTMASIKLDVEVATYFALRNFPNLQRLSLDGFLALYLMLLNEENSEDRPGVHSSLKDLELILEEDTSFKNLERRLDFDFLWKFEFPALERLSVNFLHGRHNSCFKFLRMLLVKNFEKLKVLEVSCRPYVHPYYNFPIQCQMNQLTELRLWGNVVRDLSFLKWTPKLKVLHMDPYGLEKKNVPEPKRRGNMHKPTDVVEAALRVGGMEGVVLHDLEYLQFMHNYGGYSLQSLKTLGVWMPNVKTLRTVLDWKSVAVISEQWPFLEKLIGMYGSDLTDEDITGNSKEAQEKKGLVDFAELKVFHLNAACDAGELTDLAVHSGFLKMSKLTDLQICVSDKFTLEAEKLLKDRILNAVVIRNYAGNEEHVNWECCKNKDWMKFLHGGRICTSESDSTTDSEDEYYDEEEIQSESEDDEQEETTENNDEEEEEKSQEESGDDTEEEEKGSNGKGTGEVD